MRNVIKLLIFFLLCVTLKFLRNYKRYRNTIKIKEKYEKWIYDSSSVPDMETYKHDILTLFKQANVKDAHIPFVESIGYNKITSGSCSILDNMFIRKKHIASGVLDMFDQAIGYYRSAYKSSFSPLYWIETIVFLPKNIIEYVGADLEKTAVKIVNVILTAMWWVITLIFTLYKVEILHVLQSFLYKLA